MLMYAHHLALSKPQEGLLLSFRTSTMSDLSVLPELYGQGPHTKDSLTFAELRRIAALPDSSTTPPSEQTRKISVFSPEVDDRRAS